MLLTIVLTISLLFPAFTGASFSNPQIFDGFPYSGKPFHAAVTVAVARLPADKRLKRSRIVLLPERVDMEGFDNARGMAYKYATQSSAADLVFIVPGFGASGTEAVVELLANIFYKAGYNVATLPSPLSFSFTRHVSKSATIGNFTIDATELFGAAKAIKSALISKGARVRNIRFMGYSYGGLTVAHMHRLNTDGSLMGNVARYTAVNSPIDMNYAMDTLQSYTEIIATQPPKYWSRVYSYAFGKFYEKLLQHDLDSDYYNDLNGVERLKESNIKFLIQYGFRDSLKWLIFATNQINRLGLIPRATYWRRNPAYIAASKWTFSDYVEKLLPLAFPNDARNPRILLANQGLLQALDNIDNSDFTALHAKNDFLVTEGDLAALRAILERSGGSMVLFDDSGHMGAFWWPAWQAELVRETTR